MKKTIKNNKMLTKFLFEQEDVIAPSQTDKIEVPKNFSLDEKVDKYLMSYEKSAIPTNQDYDQEMVSSGALIDNQAQQQRYESKKPNKKQGILESLFLKEAPEDELGGGFGGPADAPPDVSGGDMGAPDAGAGADMGLGQPSDAPLINTPKINLNAYCQGVARLIMNYQALLNPTETILNRSVEYIRANYDQATAQMVEEMLVGTYNIKRDSAELTRDKNDAPLAVGSSPTAAGG